MITVDAEMQGNWKHFGLGQLVFVVDLFRDFDPVVKIEF